MAEMQSATLDRRAFVAGTGALIVGIALPRGVRGQVHVHPIVIEHPHAAGAKFGQAGQPPTHPHCSDHRWVGIRFRIDPAPHADEGPPVHGGGDRAHGHSRCEQLPPGPRLRHRLTFATDERTRG